MRFALALWIALAACQNNPSSNPSPNPSPSPSPKQTSPSPSTSTSTTATAPAAGDPCEHVGDGVKAIWDKQVADATDDATRKAASEMREKAVARLQRHCREDGWTAEAAECIRSGTPCPGKLTDAQRQKLQADDLNKQAP